MTIMSGIGLNTTQMQTMKKKKENTSTKGTDADNGDRLDTSADEFDVQTITEIH